MKSTRLARIAGFHPVREALRRTEAGAARVVRVLVDRRKSGARRVEIDGKARDGDTLRLGSADFTVLHTPGHTPGSICLWLPSKNKVIAGDTLFRNSVGRTDLPGGDFRKILVSIRDKLLTLPEETMVVPGHGDTTTIGREKEFNYFLQGL